MSDIFRWPSHDRAAGDLSTHLYRFRRRLRLSRVGRRVAYAWRRGIGSKRVDRHLANATLADPSHAGEWPYMRDLLGRLDLLTAGFAVDLAAGDGITSSCTLPLFRDYGWSGLAIEGDDTRFALLRHLLCRFPSVRPLHAWVTPDTVVDLLREHGVPAEPTLVNLDVDSYDLEIATRILEAFRPAVLDLEVNEKIPPPVRFAVGYDANHRWDESHFYGCSISAADDVIGRAGYRLAGLQYNNAFFVRDDLADRGGIPRQSPGDAYRRGYRGRPDRSALFPWNVDVEDLLDRPPEEVVRRLESMFRKYEGRFILQVEPLRREQGAGSEIGRLLSAQEFRQPSEGSAAAGSARPEAKPGESRPEPFLRARPTGEREEGGSASGANRGHRGLPLDAFDLEPRQVERLLRDARLRGNPRYPWPSVPVSSWRAWLTELERVVARILMEDCEPTDLLDPVGGDGSVESLSVAAYTSGLGPLLGWALERSALRASAPHADLLALHVAHGRGRAASLRRVLVESVELLRSSGIPVTVLKGAHTSAVYFPEPGTRPAADVDLLVPAEGFAAAGRALAAAGYRAGAAQRRPAKQDWIPPGSPDLPRSLHLAHADDPISVEIHESLGRDFNGVTLVELSSASPGETSEKVHPEARVLAPAPLAAFLALHASQELHHLQMIRLVELALVLRTERARGRLQDGDLAGELRASGGLRFALPALDLVEKLMPGTVEAELLEAARGAASGRMLRYLANARPSSVQRLEGVTLEERFIWANGARETLLRMADLVLPIKARGSARPVGVTLADRFLGIVRGRVRLRGHGRHDRP